jgi:hypothetical protein
MWFWKVALFFVVIQWRASETSCGEGGGDGCVTFNLLPPSPTAKIEKDKEQDGCSGQAD